MKTLAAHNARRRLAGTTGVDPERMLWARVLLEAVHDGELEAWSEGTDDGCRCSGECFETVCEWAGLEPEAVRGMASDDRRSRV